MKAKAADEDGVEQAGGVRPALKSFLQQVISDQQDGINSFNSKKTVNALSRLIDLPALDKKEPPGVPAKPKLASANNNKNVNNVRNQQTSARKEVRPAAGVVDAKAVRGVPPPSAKKPEPPSLTKKPALTTKAKKEAAVATIIVGNRASVLRSVPPAIMDEVVALSSKIHQLQDTHDARPSKVALVRKRPSFAKQRVGAGGNKVKAAVKMFEPAAEEHPAAAISDVPKEKEVPTMPTPVGSPAASPAASPTASSKRSREALRARSQANKTLLKTAKTMRSEERRLVVVNFDDDDIDTIPPLPSTTPPPVPENASALKNILDRANASPSPSPASAEGSEAVAPPALPARNNAAVPTRAAPAAPAAPEVPENKDSAKLKANHSFLWRSAPAPPKAQPKADPPSAANDGPSFRAVPALVQPDETRQDDDDVPPESGDEPQLYDDVVAPACDENIYDDIGVEAKKKDAQEMYETCGGGNYDDCEGEGYQFVDSAASAPLPPPPPPPLPPLPVAEEEDEEGDNIYDDVLSERRPDTPAEGLAAAAGVADDAVSTSGVYEAIYLVRPRASTGTR
ncbi:nucleolar protein dao-5-like [Thrips palmi]|uniref:Nucleolar protein dao-5-like n=1 Tax=Thrips palmi TaxID=161013 RepID=A0A6P8ZSU3_THRPL|nr:nucleolar protein dao-5-like [Thrips palmi]